jgi:hypothetical protein
VLIEKHRVRVLVDLRSDVLSESFRNFQLHGNPGHFSHNPASSLSHRSSEELREDEPTSVLFSMAALKPYARSGTGVVCGMEGCLIRHSVMGGQCVGEVMS